MKNKVNDKVVENMIDYVKENIPSIKHVNHYDVSFNEVGDLEFYFFSDRTVIWYMNTINHSYTRDYVTIMSKHEVLGKDYLKNQVKEYKNRGIRLITLFDITCNNHVFWNSNYPLWCYDGKEKLDKLVYFDRDGIGKDNYIVLDCRFGTYDNFYYKDHFELVEDIGEPDLYVWGKQNVVSISDFYKEVLKDKYYRYISNNEQIRRVLNRGYFCFYDAGSQLLKLKD